MTSEQKVRQKYPRAYAERYLSGMQEAYYLVWSSYGQDKIRLSEGKTKSNAWVNAAKNIRP